MRHLIAVVGAILFGLSFGVADAQQQYDAGGKARNSNYCTTTTPGDTPCPASPSIALSPTATATNSGITIVSSSALESSHVLKASAGNLYSVYVTTGAVQGWLLTVNATSAPTAGGAAIAPVDCVYAPANQTTGFSMSGDPPDAYSTGIVAVFSSSGCLTNTASNTVFFKGRVK